MALLVLCLCRELLDFASHSRGDPLLTNDVLYQLSYSGPHAAGRFPPRSVGVFRPDMIIAQEKMAIANLHKRMSDAPGVSS